jgi:alpha-galactosidase/6-phospho-beta-glucosidase family protein
VRDADVVCRTSIPHLASVRDVSLPAGITIDRHDALRDADFVVVNISTGGFRSMRHAVLPLGATSRACASSTAVASAGAKRCRSPTDDVATMTDEMLAATAEWLPKFVRA